MLRFGVCVGGRREDRRTKTYTSSQARTIDGECAREQFHHLCTISAQLHSDVLPDQVEDRLLNGWQLLD
jgi:hypothetical protein